MLLVHDLPGFMIGLHRSPQVCRPDIGTNLSAKKIDSLNAEID
jgi:hypothetical protein